jgi:hypothetical protein
VLCCVEVLTQTLFSICCVCGKKDLWEGPAGLIYFFASPLGLFCVVGGGSQLGVSYQPVPDIHAVL